MARRKGLDVPHRYAARVLERTLKVHLKNRVNFLGWTTLKDLPTWPAALFDGGVADYCEELFTERGSRAEATLLLGALPWARPSWIGPIKRAFPTTGATLAG